MCKQNLLFIEPIVHGNLVVNFDIGNVKNSVVYVGEDGKPLIWEGCVVKNMVYQNKKYHILYSDKEGKKLNRRESYRQFIGTRGILQIDNTHETKEVIIKDISLSGIALVLDDSTQLTDIGNFHLNYEDRDCKINVQLAGRLIRQEDADGKRRIFGGVINRSNVDLSGYITTKQKLEISKKRSH